MIAGHMFISITSGTHLYFDNDNTAAQSFLNESEPHTIACQFNYPLTRFLIHLTSPPHVHTLTYQLWFSLKIMHFSRSLPHCTTDCRSMYTVKVAAYKCRMGGATSLVKGSPKNYSTWSLPLRVPHVMTQVLLVLLSFM